jgi:hypothetical protein
MLMSDSSVSPEHLLKTIVSFMRGYTGYYAMLDITHANIFEKLRHYNTDLVDRIENIIHQHVGVLHNPADLPVPEHVIDMILALK